MNNYKYIGIIILVLIVSCINIHNSKTINHNKNILQQKNTDARKDSLFALIVDLKENKENYVQIIAPKDLNFKTPDSTTKAEIYKVGDFNADNKKDIMVNLGACGTGGCIYALFLKQYGNYYKLAFMDYLKNAEFEKSENGNWIIKSTEEIEPYHPLKVEVSVFKLDKNNFYKLDTTFIEQNK